MNGTTARTRGWRWLPPALGVATIVLLVWTGGWSAQYHRGLKDGAPCEAWHPPCTSQQATAVLDREALLTWLGAGTAALGLLLDAALPGPADAEPAPDGRTRRWGSARVAATTAVGWVLLLAAGTAISFVTTLDGGVAAPACCVVLTIVALYALVAVAARAGGATHTGARRASLGALVASTALCLCLLEASGQNPAHNGTMPADAPHRLAIVLALGLPVVAPAAAVRAARTGRATRAR